MTFQIDTGNDGGGSRGPWLSWTSNGSMQKQLQAKSWSLRGKSENDEKFEHNVPAFETGCVMDLDTLQLGWMKDGGQGQAPIKQWNPSISQATPRPDEGKKDNGKFAWSNALSIRCAIGDGKAATWEQSAFGAYDAFSKLAKKIGAEWSEKSQNGALLPLVKQSGVEAKVLSSGTSNQPVLEIVQWVPRPDCLKDDAPTIATEPAPVEQTPPPAAQPAQEGATAGGF